MAPKKQPHHQEAFMIKQGLLHGEVGESADGGRKKKLEVVLKCQTFGTCEAVAPIIEKLKVPDVDVKVIHSAVGPVSKSDLLMAQTGSKLVLGFEVGLMPKLDQWVKDHGVEVRLYNVIYRLADDLKSIAQSLKSAPEPEERIIGRGQVIALFKTSKGVIVGFQITEGSFITGKEFRIIAAMGPIYSGRIETLQIERNPVKEAAAGQQIGIKIHNFNKAKVGDLIECFETATAKASSSWKPSGSVVHLES